VKHAILSSHFYPSHLIFDRCKCGVTSPHSSLTTIDNDRDSDSLKERVLNHNVSRLLFRNESVRQSSPYFGAMLGLRAMPACDHARLAREVELAMLQSRFCPPQLADVFPTMRTAAVRSRMLRIVFEDEVVPFFRVAQSASSTGSRSGARTRLAASRASSSKTLAGTSAARSPSRLARSA